MKLNCSASEVSRWTALKTEKVESVQGRHRTPPSGFLSTTCPKSNTRHVTNPWKESRPRRRKRKPDTDSWTAHWLAPDPSSHIYAAFNLICFLFIFHACHSFHRPNLCFTGNNRIKYRPKYQINGISSKHGILITYLMGGKTVTTTPSLKLQELISLVGNGSKLLPMDLTFSYFLNGTK